MSTALDVSLKVLYVQGPAAEVDRAATEQLRKASAELQITTIAGSAAALAELRRTPGWQALFASPSLPQNEVLALIASLRRDRIPIAIVPILDDVHQDLFASAVATGADDVLVRRNGTLVNINETLTRIRQSPHLFPAEQRRRISVLYAGRDPLVWNLLDQVPFVKADRVTTGIDGTCPVRRPGAGDDSLRADAVIIDEAPGDAHPLQVLKSVKAQASDLPVIMLTSAGAADIATAALELGADDTVLKTGIFRRRLIATLRRVHQRLELTAQQHETKTREERLRQIVENVPTGIMVVAGDGRVLAMNAAALHLFAASKPRDIVGRDFRDLVDTGARDSMTELIRQVTKGEAGGLTFEARTLAGDRLQARIDAVVLERDARGGRGLVASITRAVQAPADAETDARATAELATLRDALQTLERHYGELEDARTLERAAWESERQRLEARLEEAERLAAERRTVEERLAEVTAELARTSQSFAVERQALELRLQELDTAAREASAVGAARAELEQALEAVREEQRQAIAAHALERSGWQDIRAELEARVQQLDQLHQSEQDTLVASLQQDVQRLEQTLNEEGARWQNTREQLEAELRNAREALWAEHTERDATRATFEAELAALRTTLDAERASWQQARGTVEDELSAVRAAAASAEADRDRVRAELEQQLRDARGALEAERGDWQATRQTLEDARRQIEAALEHERSEWTERRLAFEDERRQLLERGVQAGDLAAERSRLATELETARQQRAAERAAIESDLARTHEQAERAEESLRALADEYDATRARLEQERDRASAELTDVRVVIEAQLAHLEAELAAARDQLAALVAERDAIRQRSLDDLSALEQTRTAERETWEQRVAALESSLAETTATMSQHEGGWQQERSQLLQAAADARTHAEQERGHLVSLHARELEEWRQAVEQARSERDQTASRLDSLEAELDTARRQIVELDYVRAALEIARADQDQAHQRAQALDTELQTAIRQHQAELEPLRAALDTARADHEQTQQRVAALEADLDDARRQLAELDPLRAALDTARADHEQTRQRVAALEADLDDARRQLAELEPLRAALDAARVDHEHAQQRVHAVETELGELRLLAGEHQNLLDALEAARSEIRHTDAAHHAERDEWDRNRQTLERNLRELEATLHNERDSLILTRAELEAEAAAAATLVREQQFLNDTIASLRADCSALAGSLADERADRDRDQHELERLRAALADSRSHLAEMDAALDRAARSADEQLTQQRARHEARERDLEEQVRELSALLGEARAATDAVRATLQSSYTRASQSHARLVASDAFGYAVTTMTGELVRCNDAFARVFGYADAPEAQSRTAGRPFPGLAARPDISNRLAVEGHVDRVVSCVDRIDGRAVRIIESAMVLAGERDGDPSLVEHIIVPGPAGPTPEEIQSRRLQDVGALTTAMMPELESLSSAVEARSTDLAKTVDARGTAGHDSNELRAASGQVATLIRQLAAFSRRQVRGPEALDLGEAVRAAEAVLTRLVGDYIGFATDLGPTTPVTTQPDAFDQLLTSMVTLGRDLLPAGGSITVQVRQQDAASAGASSVPGPVLAVKASGYGVQFPGATAALDLVAERCGGTVHVSGEAGRVVRIEVLFPRCGMPARW